MFLENFREVRTKVGASLYFDVVLTGLPGQLKVRGFQYLPYAGGLVMPKSQQKGSYFPTAFCDDTFRLAVLSEMKGTGVHRAYPAVEWEEFFNEQAD